MIYANIDLPLPAATPLAFTIAKTSLSKDDSSDNWNAEIQQSMMLWFKILIIIIIIIIIYISFFNIQRSKVHDDIKIYLLST